MIEPFDYQRKDLNKIVKGLKENNRLLYQLSTGGGKTYIFSFLSQWWVKAKRSKVVILCHRTELIDQTIASMNSIGLTCEKLTRDVKKLSHHADVYVCMIETANKRLQKNPYLFKNVGLVVADECHILIFDKVFNYFVGAKILGCSATPIVSKRVKFWRCKFCKKEGDELFECCRGAEADEWSRPFRMASLYDDIVCGIPVQELIALGKLVKEVTIKEPVDGLDSLKIDSEGNFTNESLEEVFDTDEATFNALLHYETYCIGKKTMVFNSTSKANLHLYEKFLEAGYTNVRMYDSVNKKESGNRKELLKWYKDTPDAVLLNVGVFTTGFDQTDVQAIILNLATMSLSAFIQMVGRGVRATKIIYKDYCIVIDGGGNVDRFQEFSDPTRDWEKIFREGIGKEKIRKVDAYDTNVCESCNFIYPKNVSPCPNCSEVIEVKQLKPIVYGDQILVPIREIPPPDGKRIYRYTVDQGQDVNFAFKILMNQICDLFIFYRVPKDVYLKTKVTGECQRKVKDMIRKCFFFLIAQKDIQTESHRTIKNLVDRTIEKLDKIYKL